MMYSCYVLEGEERAEEQGENTMKRNKCKS
jgi:hypothetical protein